MNKYRQFLLDQEILRDLHILGIHIKEPSPERRTKKLEPGIVLVINDEPCALIELESIGDHRETWKVYNLVSREEVYELI